MADRSLSQRVVEQLGWSLVAVAAGIVSGSVDQRSSEVQSTVLVLMSLNFGIALPGRAWWPLTALLTVLSMAAWISSDSHQLNPGLMIAFVPAAMAAGAGALFGRLLEKPAALSRQLLALVLIAIAIAGLHPVQTALHAVGHPLADWLGGIWQVLTLLAWIVATAIVIRTVGGRARLQPHLVAPTLTHLVVLLLAVILLTAAHAVGLVVATACLFIPVLPSPIDLVVTAFRAYLPFDALSLIAAIAVGYAADADRLRAVEAQRAAALEAESLQHRLGVLRARLNPHFLFNALNSVHVLAAAGKSLETARLVEGLNGLLRYVLDERRADVPLAEELAFVRGYLEVQRVRFGDRLRFSVNVAHDVGDAVVPQLLLQPIVENAVERGLAASLGGGSVDVDVRRIERDLVLAIEDDGAGPAESSSGSGIGLSSTRERLARLFGRRAGITVVPRPNGGTRAEIRIPYTIADPAKI